MAKKKLSEALGLRSRPVPVKAPEPEPVVGLPKPARSSVVGSADPLPPPGEVWVPPPSKARKG